MSRILLAERGIISSLMTRFESLVSEVRIPGYCPKSESASGSPRRHLAFWTKISALFESMDNNTIYGGPWIKTAM